MRSQASIYQGNEFEFIIVRSNLMPRAPMYLQYVLLSRKYETGITITVWIFVIFATIPYNISIWFIIIFPEIVLPQGY